jgi:hypothetical protein
MNADTPPRGKKFFTPEQANSMLPLVGRIVQDITTLAQLLRERHHRIVQLQAVNKARGGKHQDELDALERDFEQGQTRMEEYQQELEGLGIELKDYFSGLIDFPCWMDGREVYLCWLQGEPEVSHWHEIHAGFAGRQKLYQVAKLR